jgi:hypothetical protein
MVICATSKPKIQETISLIKVETPITGASVSSALKTSISFQGVSCMMHFVWVCDGDIGFFIGSIKLSFLYVHMYNPSLGKYEACF